MNQDKPKITIKNIGSFISGYGLVGLENITKLPQHIKEQIEYRHKICADCIKLGHCPVCKCKLPEKHYSFFRCDGNKYPNLMNKKNWLLYKQNNNIC